MAKRETLILFKGKRTLLSKLANKYTSEYLSYNEAYHLLYCRYFRDGKRDDALVAPMNALRRGSTSYKIKKVIINRKRQYLLDVSKDYNIPIYTMIQRYKAGKRGDDLIKPIRQPIKIKMANQMLSVKKIANHYHLKPSLIRGRYYRGKRGKDLIQSSHSNQPATIKIDWKNEKLSINEIAKKYNISPSIVRGRYKNGKKGIDLIRPTLNKTTIINGDRITFAEAAYQYGLNEHTIRYRYNRGLRDQDLIKPVKR